MKTIDKIAFGSVAVIIVTNPASSQVILEGLEYGFELIFKYASPINFLASAVLMAYIGMRIWASREKVTIPKNSKVKTQKYLA